MTRSRRLARLAVRAPVPVYPVVGARMRARVQRLRLDPRVTLVSSPRHATVLLVAGALPHGTVDAAAQVHDALPRPRATVWWAPPGDRAPGDAPFAAAATVAGDDDVVAVLERVHRDLMLGSRSGEPPILPDEDPVAWRGEGPYGHGGTGMSGGTPYGRPLADRDEDLRDGLSLDVVPITIGPFVPFLPPGLALRVVFKGDLVHELEVPDHLPFDRGEDPGPDAPPPIAVVERARAGHHLRWFGWALHVHGLSRLGTWALELAESDAAGPADLDRLERRLRRSGLFTWHTRTLGRLPADRVAGSGLGPVARASGVAEDARSDDPGYRALGFDPVTHDEGDARSRWLQRLAETRQSLELAERAGSRVVGDRPEPTHGTAPGQRRLLELLPELAVGLEWGDAVAVLVSLDLDLELAASRDRAVP